MNASCTDIPGSYVCSCVQGYEGNGTFCESMVKYPYLLCLASIHTFSDVDECQNDTLNTCDDNADCFDTEGSFTCICREGYDGTGIACGGKFCS